MLHRTALCVIAAGLAPLCWAGPGLRGEYFANATLSGAPVLTRTDPMVTFASTGSPGPGVPAENFSVRWTGQVQAPATAAYRFSTFTDDGVRLWVNGVLLIDAWTPHGFRRDMSNQVYLTSGQRYSIRMEFYKTTGFGAAILLWTQGSGPELVIGQEYLYDTAPSPTSPPGAPSGLSATGGNAQVFLSWSSAAGAASYNVYRGTASGGQASTPVATGIAGTNWVNTGLVNGTRYYYTVAAVNSTGTGPRSNEASATPQGTSQAPPTPTGLSATAGNAQVSLAWSASAGAASYTVYRTTTSGALGSVVATGIAGTAWVNTGLTNNTTYYFRVAAVNGAGQSTPSGQVSARPVAPPVPAKPTGLSAAAGNAQVTLNWNSQADANTYRVYRSQDASVSGAVIASGLTSPTYLDRAVVNETYYYYRVSAVNTNGESSLSSQVGAKPRLPPVPAAPTGLTATPGTGQITLAWNAVSTADTYSIYRSTTSGGQGTTPVFTGITSPTFIDTGLVNGTTYYYRVAGVNAGGTGSKSSQASGTPAAPAVLLSTAQRDAFRFLRQATWGPNQALVDRVASIGKEAFLEEQFNAPQSQYPQALIDAPNMELVSERFFQNGIEGQDQLRQRVAWALSQIFVVSAVKVDNTHAMVPYIRMLHARAFGNVLDLMRDVTLSPAMGEFLDMVNNRRATNGAMPNENYAREVMQLMSIGLTQLNPNGSPVMGGNGQPVPSYTQNDILELSRVLTGWTYGDTVAGDPIRANREYYNGPMEPVAAYHDPGAKVVLGQAFPAGQTARQDLEQALALLFNHPNTGPFLCRQLIQRLVSSNPSPAYIQDVVNVFNNNGQGVRGDLRAIVRAILLHPEASSTAISQRKFQEPALFLLALTRALNATVVDHPYLSDFSQDMAQRIWYAPSVFNYFSPNYRAGTIFAPELQIWTTANAMTRTNFVASLVSGGFGSDLTFDRTRFNAVAGVPQSLVDTVDSIVMGGTMSAEMKQAIVTAVNAAPSISERVRTALYLAAASMQYQVEH